MQLAGGHRLEELARRVGGRVVGDPARRVVDVAPLDRARAEHLGFLTNPRYRASAEQSAAGALLVPPDSGLEGRDLIEVDEPYWALAEILALFHPATRSAPGVSPRAALAEDVTLGQDVTVEAFAVIEAGSRLGDEAQIGAGCVLGRDCRVGARSRLMPGVVLYPGTLVGADCLIHAGVVLGGDGFGFATRDGRHRKMPQLGRVVIEDEVEIGANTTVDRGTLDETRVGQGTKIDDLVMVAHGVQLGPRCLLAAQTGIAGSTQVGQGVVFAGQSGAAGHLRIADGTVVGAKTAVLGDIPTRQFVAGIPAVDHRSWKRAQASVQRLPEMRREVRRLRERVAALERKLGLQPGED